MKSHDSHLIHVEHSGGCVCGQLEPPVLAQVEVQDTSSRRVPDRRPFPLHVKPSVPLAALVRCIQPAHQLCGLGVGQERGVALLAKWLYMVYMCSVYRVETETWQYSLGLG